MPRIIFLFLLYFFACSSASATPLQISHQGLIGAYYGISESEGSHSQFSNRGVFRTDGKLTLDYDLSPANKVSLINDYTVLFRTEDKSYRDGDWR